MTVIIFCYSATIKYVNNIREKQSGNLKQNDFFNLKKYYFGKCWCSCSKYAYTLIQYINLDKFRLQSFIEASSEYKHCTVFSNVLKFDEFNMAKMCNKKKVKKMINAVVSVYLNFKEWNFSFNTLSLAKDYLWWENEKELSRTG